MSIEDDVARVNAVTDALTGPQKVWVLTATHIDRGVNVHASCYTTEAIALTSLENGFDRDFYTEDTIQNIVACLLKDGVCEDGDTTLTLEQCRVWAE